jgi:RHS repeat-associated protein
VYDVQDRLLSLGATTYAYSNHGDVASKTDASGTTTYDFDELGNLHRAERPAPAAPIDYVIDAANRRVGKRVNGTLVKGWLYQDGLRVVAELDGTGNVVSRFVYGTTPNVPEYLVQGATTYRIVSDHLGSVRLVVNAATGVVAQRIDYDEWGVPTYVTGAPDFQPFGFAGGLHDPDTALVRFGARDYDPTTGRWTSKDPIRFAGAGGGSLYDYVQADPVNGLDPSGLIGHREVANFSAGFGDALLLGLGAPLRRLIGGSDFIDQCSDAYRYGGYGALAAGVARLAYAGAARIGAAAVTSGIAANVFRNGLKAVFRGWVFPNYRSLSYVEALAKYGTDDAVRAAAGRTNVSINSYGAAVAGFGAFSSTGCGCPERSP